MRHRLRLRHCVGLAMPLLCARRAWRLRACTARRNAGGSGWMECEPTPERVISTYAELVERVGKLPHVIAATATSTPPLAGGTVDVSVRAEGRTYEPGRLPFTHYRTVVPGYFEALRNP